MVYGAVINGRRGIGVELKKSYYNQAVKNLREAVLGAVLAAHSRAVNGRGKAAEKRAAAIKAALRAAGDAVKP
jgi:hypothetical protein